MPNHTPIPISASQKSQSEFDIRSALYDRLLSLPFAAFARCMTDLLTIMNYSKVQLAGRKDWRGRNGTDGAAGYDFHALREGGGVQRRVLGQMKQFDREQRIYQRSIDELRGVCLRNGASEAVLMTTGTISSRVSRPVVSASPLAPVRLIDGDELLDLLLTHRIGIWQEIGEDVGQNRYGLDEDYFASLTRESHGNGRDDCAVASEVRVTVAIQPIYRNREQNRLGGNRNNHPRSAYR